MTFIRFYHAILLSLPSVLAKTFPLTGAPVGPAREPLKLYLTPMNTALFSFYVVFAGCTFFQISSGHREIRDEKVHRLPYIISFISILFYLASWIMGALYVAEGLSTIPSKTSVVVVLPTFTAMRALAMQLGHLTITAAVLVMIYQRLQLFAKGKTAVPVWKKLIDGVLFLAGAGAAAATAYIRTTITFLSLAKTRSTYLTVDRINVAFFTICVVNVWMSGLYAHIQMRRAGHSDGYMRQIVNFILPLLSIQALNLVAQSVITRMQPDIQYQAYYMACMIITGFSGVASIHLFQALYRQDEKNVSPENWPLKERDRERWRE